MAEDAGEEGKGEGEGFGEGGEGEGGGGGDGFGDAVVEDCVEGDVVVVLLRFKSVF